MKPPTYEEMMLLLKSVAAFFIVGFCLVAWVLIY
jgi:hypothetical protein